MKTRIIKQGKGHEVYIDGVMVFWLTGSRKAAEKELSIYLKKQ